MGFPRLLAVFLLCCVAVFVNLVLGAATITGEAYFCAGSLFYLLFLKLVRFDRNAHIDYIQSGEAWLALSILFLAAVIISGHAGILFGISLCAFAVMEFFLRAIAGGSRREQTVIGAAAGILFLLIFFHLVSLGLEPARLGVLFVGYIHAVPTVWWPLPCLAVIFGGLYYLYRKAVPELALYSHGKSYFAAAGFPYRFLDAGTAALRGVLLAMVFLLAGVLAGAGGFLLLRKEHHRRSVDLESFFIVFLAINCLTLLSRYLTGLAVGMVAIAVSWAAYLFFSRRGAYD